MQARREGDAETLTCIPDLANEILGWKTEFDIEDCCKDSWNWASKNPNGYE